MRLSFALGACETEPVAALLLAYEPDFEFTREDGLSAAFTT
jgi:hypothetical protein